MEYSVVFDVPHGFDQRQESVDYAKLTEISYYSTTVGRDRTANIILPPSYTEKNEYPVLYLLHGLGGDPNEWLNGTPVEILSNLIKDGLATEMIIVLPNVRARMDDARDPKDVYTLEHYQAFDNFINDLRDDLMPYIQQHYSVKTGKENTAVAGLSMGGRESLYIGLTMPETFGYIGAFEPAPGILSYTNYGISERGLFTPDNFLLPDGADNFIMIVKGKQDDIVREFPLLYHETLQKNKVKHTYYEMDGGHDFTVWKHSLYNFLRAIFHRNF